MPELSAIDDARIFAPPPASEPTDELGQQDFLTLMITQFQNQDPFKPMENGEFLGQLAQFSTVSGIDSLNQSFESMAGALQNEQALQASALVGHSVLAATDIGYLGEGATLDGGIEILSSASTVQIDITDASGQLVKRLNLGEQPPGLMRFTWDGLDNAGERADEGHYQISARVSSGTYVESAETLIEARIDSITLGRNGRDMTLNLEGGDALSLNQVHQII